MNGSLTPKRSSPDEDHGKRYARNHGGVQHIIAMPAPEALSPVLKGTPGSTQAACSREPVCSMPEDSGIPVGIQAASLARKSRNSHCSKGRNLYLPGRGEDPMLPPCSVTRCFI